MKKLLISDLDDTHFGWRDFFVPAFYAMAEEVVSITGIDKAQLLREYKERHQFYKSVEFPYVTLTLPSVVEKYKGCTQDEIKEILNEAFHRFNSVRKRELKLFPNVAETLKELHDRGVTIIGYTESSQENGFYRLGRLGIEEYFKFVYVSDSMYEAKYPISSKIKRITTKKPDTEILAKICADENCELCDVVYVGDSITKDMYMAYMAGVTSVWYKKSVNNEEYYSMLDDITSWSDADFERERQLKEIWEREQMQSDYEISDFKTLKDIVF